MSDGLWNVGASLVPSHQALESIRRAGFIRHRILQFNLSSAGTRLVGDASSFGSVPPMAIISHQQEGGPHFVFSNETTDGTKTLGFEWTLFNDGVPVPAVPEETGFTVTIWELIGNAQLGSTIMRPIWASFQPRLGVFYNELYHSFDVNATAIRFQITDFLEDSGGPGEESSVAIAFAEL